MTTEEEETYIKYDGKDAKKFREWAMKVKAIASRRGWLHAIHKDMPIDRKSTDAKEIKLMKNNDKAYQYLVMACAQEKHLIMYKQLKVQKALGRQERLG